MNRESRDFRFVKRQQQPERPGQPRRQCRKHEAHVGRNVDEDHRVKQPETPRHVRRGQLRCGAQQTGPEEEGPGLKAGSTGSAKTESSRR